MPNGRYGRRRGYGRQRECRKPAKAPYNFVPLNNKVVSWQEPPPFDIYHRDKLSGYIDLEIETKTPLYIRRESEDESFFSIEGKVKIPGSSIRGMVRTLVEIVSFGKFKFFDDSTLYYRGLADVRPLRRKYNGKIRERQAGFLYYDGRKDKYYIKPAQGFKRFRNVHREFYIEEHNDGIRIWSGGMQGKKKNWIVLKPCQRGRDIELSEVDIKDYINDKNRNIPSYYDLLEIARNRKITLPGGRTVNLPDGAPVFYAKYTDHHGRRRIAFGHTGFFRLPYELSIGDHIPKDLKSNQTVDFAESIFGVEDKWATRVYFEDANALEGQDDILLEPTSPKILSSPKPTTFQHYLEQGGKTEKNNLKHWGDRGANIRGYKLYWHRNTPSKGEYGWSEGKIVGDTQHCIITPVREGVKFRGRIRFENLSKEELGALLFVLDLPSNHYHKLGMGKPLGLGSVKITPTLYIINRKERYKKLFSSSNWNTAETREDNMSNYKKVFEKYILRQIGSSNTKSLWELDRLKELKIMLNWENTQRNNWLEKTRYMLIECEVNKYDCICEPRRGNKCNEFRNRPVLPKPREVVK